MAQTEGAVERVEDGTGADRAVRERRAALLGRSVAAPVILAATTIAGLAGAVFALLPAAIRGRPAGRAARPRGLEEGPAGSDAASEPLAP